MKEQEVKKIKKYKWRFVNRWSNYVSYRIDIAPSLHVVKQLKSFSIGIEWLGFVIDLEINKTV